MNIRLIEEIVFNIDNREIRKAEALVKKTSQRLEALRAERDRTTGEKSKRIPSETTGSEGRGDELGEVDALGFPMST